MLGLRTSAGVLLHVLLIISLSSSSSSFPISVNSQPAISRRDAAVITQPQSQPRRLSQVLSDQIRPQQQQTQPQLALPRAQFQQTQPQQPQPVLQPRLPQLQLPQPQLPRFQQRQSAQLAQQQQPQQHPQLPVTGRPRHHRRGGRGHRRRQLPPGTAREFLEAHNRIRAGYGEPPLQWSNKLARFAHRHGSKIVTSPNCMNFVHSNGPYGESLFWSKQAHWTPTAIVDSWAEEVNSYNLKTNSCSDTTGSGCGHYTQIVWWDAARVGCQYLQCHPPGVGYIGICNYDPPGNVEGQGPWSTAPNKMPPRMPPILRPL